MLLEGSCHCRAVRFELRTATPYPYMRCYCSICRKTAGGGGFAINLMGAAETLKVRGRKAIRIYRAMLAEPDGAKGRKSSARRHFCMHCGSALWVFDPHWPDLVHPFASAIDTPLPKAPEEVEIMLDFAPPWCKVPRGRGHRRFARYPDRSIEDWHRSHGLLIT